MRDRRDLGLLGRFAGARLMSFSVVWPMHIERHHGGVLDLPSISGIEITTTLVWERM